ncbi:MAG TPA: isocitrate dehydrogenase kinase/phosphatase AceK regulatory subunit [Burkholderiaceae bacterium]|nr:isocitrate dehydrogenase kinase/phosphatase AceK regulatory subunit [Burkholderiaceae bacterium]
MAVNSATGVAPVIGFTLPAGAAPDAQAAPADSPEVDRAYAELGACADDWSRIEAAARLILAVFDNFYRKLCEYPYRAMRAFEAMDPQASIRISKERLGLYSQYIARHGPRIRAAFAALADNPKIWDELDRLFGSMIVDHYEADIAFSFAHSIRRNIGHEAWRPVAYSFPPPSKRRALSMAQVYRRIPVQGRIDAELIASALQAPRFSVPFRDLAGDCERIIERINFLLDSDAPDAALPVALDVVEAGFFRDRYAFVVGRWVLSDSSLVAFVVALLNSDRGIFVDAVLHRVADVHNLFSSTLANFHVTTRLYYQTCVFLFSLMPKRPLGHHYSTIGFNHVGKVAILNEVIEQVRQSGHRLQRSPGFAGTVALGFTFEDCSYHLKVIRDRPTTSYKWGEFPGVAAVLDKYREVHEINRAGSMLDNVMYFNLTLDRDLFDPDLLADICRQASRSVQVEGDSVYIRSLIVQLKIVPLPLYLESADQSEIHNVIVNLGNCIRNNAATNIFNKDLDSRNYGVGRYGRVLLFDYDAVEKLTDVKIRTNLEREPGEEDIPGWFFEDGVVFLPEEIEYGLQLKNEIARRHFRKVNADLMTVRYWQQMQQMHRRGEVPQLQMYPDGCKLHAPGPGQLPTGDDAAIG